jgi:hypothetical protein
MCLEQHRIWRTAGRGARDLFAMEKLSCFNNIERIVRIHMERSKTQVSTMNEKRLKGVISEHNNAN